MISRLSNAVFNPDSFFRQVLTWGVLKKNKSPKEWFLFRTAMLRECRLRRAPYPGVACRPVEELFPPIIKTECKLKLLRPTAYNLSWEELITLSQLVVARAPRSIFEFGTFNGRTTLHLAMNSPESSVVHTIDIKQGGFDFGLDSSYFDVTEVGGAFLSTIAKGKIVTLTGDSTTYDFSKYYGKMDLVFVDGDHSYGSVLKDSETAFKLAAPGALIVWHDYLLVDDVTRAVLEMADKRPLVNLKGTSLVVWENK